MEREGEKQNKRSFDCGIAQLRRNSCAQDASSRELRNNRATASLRDGSFAQDAPRGGAPHELNRRPGILSGGGVALSASPPQSKDLLFWAGGSFFCVIPVSVSTLWMLHTKPKKS